MSLSNLAIIRKLTLGFASVFIGVALMSGTLFIILRSLDAAAALNEKSYAVVESLAHAVNAVSEEGRIARGYVILRDERVLRDFDAEVQNFAAAIAEARKDAVGHPEILGLLDKVDATATAWRVEFADAVIRLTRDNPTSEQAVELLKSTKNNEAVAAVLQTVKEARNQVDAWSVATQKDQDWSMRLAHLSLIGGGLSTALLAVFVAWWLARSIADPVTEMTETMKALAAGDASVVVPFLDRKDELGLMAAAVQTFKEAAIAKARKQAEEAEAIKAWQKEDEARAAREAEEARQDQIAINALADGLRRLADGDLIHRIETIFAPKTEKLRTDFNSSVEKLQRAMQGIHVNTQAIQSGSGEISSAADDLSRRTEQQAASLEETAATLDEITATVKNTAQGATHAQELVSSTKSDADRSGEVVRQAIAAMGGIEKSSQQIGQIIGVIDEIAFQTNLLALNAGVEAARAGDAGRGFAVVASEVRALAQRSAEAAKEIKSLISASTTQVGQGVDLVGETGKALGRIVAQVAEINSVVATIAASAQEQATALHQVNAAVNQMDQVTQQNAAMVEQTTAAAHSLRQESDELGRLLGRFQVDAEAAAEPIRAKPKRPAQAPRLALKTLPAQTRGGAARKIEPAPAEESWEEF